MYALAVSKGGKNAASALTTAYLLASKATVSELSAAYGIPMTRRDALALPVQGEADLFNKAVIMSRSWVDPNPTATADLFRAMIQDTTSGAVLTTDAVLRGEQQMNHIIGI